jgi:hypothetical protein
MVAKRFVLLSAISFTPFSSSQLWILPLEILFESRLPRICLSFTPIASCDRKTKDRAPADAGATALSEKATSWSVAS